MDYVMSRGTYCGTYCCRGWARGGGGPEPGGHGCACRVIAYYMGFTADLSVAWAPYKAACKGLGNTMAQGNIKETAAAMSSRIEPLNRKLNELLTEGVLTEECAFTGPPSPPPPREGLRARERPTARLRPIDMTPP